MDLIRRGFLAVSLTTLFASAAACGGSAAMSGGGSSTPTPVSNEGFGAAEAKSAPADSFGGGDGVRADVGGVAPSAPPPSAMKESGAARPAQGRATMDSEGEAGVFQPKPTDRPGLGTQWGETRNSSITSVAFQRAEPTNPFGMASMFYNDEEGARAMASLAGFHRTSGGMTPVAGGSLLVGLRDESGAFLNGFVAGEKNFVVGEAGRRYTIVIRNRTPNRVECVVSVDGLDVIDGRSAAFNKRGYLVQPHGELEIDGFRRSAEEVAAFRFGSVRGSYAGQKTGDTRNVGVIGFAFFHERGTNPFPFVQDEAHRRQDANPFPGQFATPP
ncbi:MAG TPA: hypothetical protein PKA58_20030 [Polyangium sp.]|nr:hypothetical protein [Polyangium sp.]